MNRSIKVSIFVAVSMLIASVSVFCWGADLKYVLAWIFGGLMALYVREVIYDMSEVDMRKSSEQRPTEEPTSK